MPGGTETLWSSPFWEYLLARAIRGGDPTCDPVGEGTLSLDEIESWDADERPKPVRTQATKILDLNGHLDRKMIAWSGSHDLVSPPSIEREYQRLVEEIRGSGQVRLYLESGADHSPFPVLLDDNGNPVGFLPEALQAHDTWVGSGTQPGPIGGLSPQ